MDTYFIRHTQELAIDDGVLDGLFQAGRIAIHYPEMADGKLGKEDNVSLDPHDYAPKWRAPIRTFNKLANRGGYVFAEYRNKRERLIGIVKPQTQIDFCPVVWTGADHANRKGVLKVLSVTRHRPIQASGHVGLLVGRPIQGTVCHWERAGRRVEDLVEGRSTPMALENLSPDLQEVMCSEFLRLENAANAGLPRITQLLLPVGRTLKDLDIIGITAEGEEVFAQVTYRNAGQSRRKRQCLTEYQRPGRHLILFCNSSKQHPVDGVTIFPLNRVFNEFVETKNGRSWLKAVLGHNS